MFLRFNFGWLNLCFSFRLVYLPKPFLNYDCGFLELVRLGWVDELLMGFLISVIINFVYFMFQQVL